MQRSIKALSIYSLSIAIVAVVTLFIKVPTMTGYSNLGGCFILIIATFVNPVAALFAGGIGSMFADILSGYVQWAIPTLIIKGSMGYIASLVLRKEWAEKKVPIKTLKIYFLATLMALYVVAGYLVFGIVVRGSVVGSLMQTTGLLVEAGVTVIAYIFFASALEKIDLKKYINLEE
ncbi:ECF transporter S component [Lachnobacterium bovis]|uniref:Uncharacterized membrane protein n=1 Tax=Lachnobacterium bovis TaxID=140626 RepID=A0A1H9P7H4_9FIRM|nr:ECF transporter S component [Lachnobacterium bovis]SER44132.1 Uncharacterized membrane protein [Lachnobacterium bovis]